MGTPFTPFSFVFEPSQSGPVYSLGLLLHKLSQEEDKPVLMGAHFSIQQFSAFLLQMSMRLQVNEHVV